MQVLGRRSSLVRAPTNSAPPRLKPLATPPWLKEGGYDSPQWIVIDDLHFSPKRAMRIRWDVQLFDPRSPTEECRLTDAKYSHLLETVKLQSFLLRGGKYGRVSTAETHEEMSRHLINFVIWMIRNAIFQFRDLDQDDFESFVNDARYGPFALLGYGPRLSEYVADLLIRGESLPQIKKPRIRLPVLDTLRLLSNAGIDPRKGARDAGVAYEIARLSTEHGLAVIPDQIERLSKGKPSPRQICGIPVYRTLEPWLTQWNMREDLPGDRLQFDPFQNVSCMRLAQQLGRKPERTKTAPIQQTMMLIDRSIRWILDYAPAILNARDKYLEIVEANPATWTQNLLKASVKDIVVPEGPGRPFPLKATARRRAIHKDLELGVAVNNCLPAACAIVICAFTGRRHEEVLTLRAKGPANDGCISEDENGLWIEAFVEKTCRDWVKTPCNELVAKAVSVLECWSAPARTASAKVGLFQLRRLTKEPIVTFRLAKSLKYSVSFLNLPALPDGSYWPRSWCDLQKSREGTHAYFVIRDCCRRARPLRTVWRTL